MDYTKKYIDAYNAWVNADNECSCINHFYLDTGQNKPDDKVCEREITWRKYVEAREEYFLWEYQTS